MLICASFFMTGNYFSYDTVGAIREQITQTAHLTDTEVSLLYTVYSYPNIVLPLFGGFFLDKIGMR